MVRTTRRSPWQLRASTVDGLDVVLQRFDHDPIAGPQFVMVHGLGVSSRYFEPLAAELADAGTVWLVDLPGYGRSPKPDRDVTVAEHAGVLGATLDAAGIAEPVLIGHSWGTQVVTALAAQRPALSGRLVLLSPTVNPARRSAWKQFSNLLEDFWREPPRADAFGLYSYFLTGRVGYYLAQVPLMIDDAIEERLVTIAAPTLVVVGERDPIVPLAWAHQAASLLSKGTLAVVAGAHVIMFTAPRELARLIREFSA